MENLTVYMEYTLIHRTYSMVIKHAGYDSDRLGFKSYIYRLLACALGKFPHHL